MHTGQDPAEIASALVQLLSESGPGAVAFSGGVDSAVVAKAAHLAWGHQAVAVTAVSPSLSQADRRIAQQVAEEIGIRHVELPTSEFDRTEYRRNASDRCYYCKDTLYSLTRGQLADLGAAWLANGANLDDLGDHRPGMQAAADHSVRSPLIELKITKVQVRQLAEHWSLSVAQKPASPCLASRIAWGVEVTEERVRQVEQAESLVRSLCGGGDLRVRLEHNELARVEVPPEKLSRLCEPSVRNALVEGLKSLGFRYVTVDLEGFRSGSLNPPGLIPLRLPDPS